MAPSPRILRPIDLRISALLSDLTDFPFEQSSTLSACQVTPPPDPDINYSAREQKALQTLHEMAAQEIFPLPAAPHYKVNYNQINLHALSDYYRQRYSPLADQMSELLRLPLEVDPKEGTLAVKNFPLSLSARQQLNAAIENLQKQGILAPPGTRMHEEHANFLLEQKENRISLQLPITLINKGACARYHLARSGQADEAAQLLSDLTGLDLRFDSQLGGLVSTEAGQDSVKLEAGLAVLREMITQQVLQHHSRIPGSSGKAEVFIDAAHIDMPTLRYFHTESLRRAENSNVTLVSVNTGRPAQIQELS